MSRKITHSNLEYRPNNPKIFTAFFLFYVFSLSDKQQRRKYAKGESALTRSLHVARIVYAVQRMLKDDHEPRQITRDPFSVDAS